MSDAVLIQNGIKQEDALSPILYNLKNVPAGRLKKTKREWNLVGHFSFWYMLMMLFIG
jgi:hypothetical protein